MPSGLDPRSTCLHLRSKEMFYSASSERDPEHDAAIEKNYGACDTTAFWCQCTQTGRGPDQGVVGRAECSQRGRTCFAGLDSLA